MMKKFRTYKNGITGIKYGAYYIIPGDNNTFTVIDTNKNILITGLKNIDDAEWHIETIAVGEDNQWMIDKIQNASVGELTALMMKFYNEWSNKPMPQDVQHQLKLVTIARNRKLKK
jgi:hypothetical protein